VFFITQNPLDVPDTVLGQLGNRVQHALRAYTPRDQKAVKAAADTFRPNPALDTAQVITELGVGEALVSFLDGQGRPNMVQRAFVLPPASTIGPVSADERKAVMAASPVAGKYEKTVDRESAYEKLAGRAQASTAEKNEEGGGLGGLIGDLLGQKGGRDTAVQSMFKSAARSIGSSVGREIVRGVLGSLLKNR
jgi:DNA helicase HerA-like ATPase